MFAKHRYEKKDGRDALNYILFRRKLGFPDKAIRSYLQPRSLWNNVQKRRQSEVASTFENSTRRDEVNIRLNIQFFTNVAIGKQY